MPQISQNPLYLLLRDEKVKEFNQRKAAGESCDLSDCDFRGLDLRTLDANGLNLKNAYFRGADLRGIDFRQANMEGASLASAQVSGAYFPHQIEASELMMSINHGTRIRYKS